MGSTRREAPARRASSARGSLIFDGECPFCTMTARWAERRLPSGAEVVPYQEIEDPQALGLTRRQLAGAAWWIDPRGGTHRGHLAVAETFRAIGGPWAVVGDLLRVPPTSWVAELVYEVVSRNRHRLPGTTPRRT
jgi:predicted DCC family thiol-disulfide oxidoreductase YuxK